jgi:hypothetical protein
MDHGPCIVNLISYYSLHTVYAMPETLACLTLSIELPARGSLDPTLTGQVAGRVIIEIYPETVQIRGRPLCCVYRAASHLLFACLLCHCLVVCIQCVPSLWCLCCPRWFHPISLSLFLSAYLRCCCVGLCFLSACSISFTRVLRLKTSDILPNRFSMAS